MRTTCLVNNYNYRQYVGEAVDSALEQTRTFDEVIVVDDGSTDDSLSYLRKRYAGEPGVSIVAQQNGGQLSAFNAGIARATGDVVFFLDADDCYRSDYVESAVETYQTHDIDFAIAGVEVFGPAASRPREVQPRRDLGYSALATILSKYYVGGPTSALSMRREIAEQVLPCPFESDWRTRADDVLVLGSSIAGARKFHLGTAHVAYRVHGQNNFSGRARSATRKLQHGLAVNRLVHWYAHRSGYDLADLPRLLHREFATIQRPTLGEWRLYAKMSWQARLPLLVRGRHFGETSLHYWRERLAPREPVAVAPAEQHEPSTLRLPERNAQQRRAA